MCGIVGIIALTEEGKNQIQYLPKATSCLASRGPNNSGTYYNNNVGLGHTRLSIIDISDAAAQPMHDSTGRYTIIYNGEIYNFKELRNDLIRKGTKFKSLSDTEVVLQMYIREGHDCLKYLNGFFAFAIYDKLEEALFVARDRIGIKPLLVYQDDDKIIFSSEMKAILAFPVIKELDDVSLYQYLQLNYIPAPATIFKQITKIMPATYLFIKEGQIETKEYYQIPYDQKEITGEKLNYQEQKERLITLLDESVQKRLIADVPLGVFLSGGIDSSVVVALASKHTQNLNTFSIGYKDEPFFDETRYANLVAKKFNTNHTVFSLSNDDLYEHLYNILDYMDEPFADSSAIAVYILSNYTAKHVKVALSGDGGDELFAGYNKHWGEYKVRNGGFAANMVSALGPLWKTLPQSRNSYFGNKARQLNRFAEGMKGTNQERYWQWCSFTDELSAIKMLKKQYD